MKGNGILRAIVFVVAVCELAPLMVMGELIMRVADVTIMLMSG